MKDRSPTAFETRVLKMIARQRGGFQSGDRQVHYVAAARRLEKLGYASKSRHWYTTDKGDEWIAKEAAQHHVLDVITCKCKVCEAARNQPAPPAGET